MATKVQEYSTSAASNGTIVSTEGSINIAENCSPAGINNALRAIMQHIADGLSGNDDSIITGTAGTSGNLAVWNADGDVVDGGAVPSGLSDGDKGDITVSSSGTVWTIDNTAISTAKIADSAVSTAKIADDAVTADKLNDTGVTAASYTNANITVDAQGRVTSASNGSSGAGLAFISSTDLSNNATLTFTGFDSGTYDAYLIKFANVIPSAGLTQLSMRTSTNGGSSYDSGASDYSYAYRTLTSQGSPSDTNAGDDAHTQILLTPVVGSDANEEGVTMDLHINGPHLAQQTNVHWTGTFTDNAGLGTAIQGAGRRRSNADVDAIQLFFSSGNLESGTISIYGYTNS